MSRASFDFWHITFLGFTAADCEAVVSATSGSPPQLPLEQDKPHFACGAGPLQLVSVEPMHFQQVGSAKKQAVFEHCAPRWFGLMDTASRNASAAKTTRVERFIESPPVGLYFGWLRHRTATDCSPTTTRSGASRRRHSSRPKISISCRRPASGDQTQPTICRLTIA